MGKIERGGVGGEQEEEQTPGERPAVEKQRNARAEAGGGEDDEVVGWPERTEGVRNARVATPAIFTAKWNFFFLRCRLIINKQPPIRSG